VGLVALGAVEIVNAGQRMRSLLRSGVLSEFITTEILQCEIRLKLKIANTTSSEFIPGSNCLRNLEPVAAVVSP